MSRNPLEWFIDINEWLDDAEQCQSGHAYSPKFLEEMEISSADMVPVVEREFADDAVKLAELLADYHGKEHNSRPDCPKCVAIADFRKKWSLS